MMQLSYHKTQDFAEVVQLYKVVFADKDPGKFDWQWRENPAGIPECFLVRDDSKNIIIGAVSIIPFKVQINGAPRFFGQLVDGMMLPEYRGGHSFNKLIQFALDNICTRFEFLIAYPNSKSLGPSLKAGFEILGDLTTYSMPLSGDYLGRKLFAATFGRKLVSLLASPIISAYLATRAYRPGSKIKLEEISSATDISDDLWTALADNHAVVGIRNQAFIKWRFLDVPTTTYQTLKVSENDRSIGYIVIRSNRYAVEVIDFCVAANEQAMHGAVTAMVNWCRDKGFAATHLKCSPGNCCVNAFKRAGFIQRKSVSKVIIMPLSEEVQLLSAADFYLTLADSDWI